MAREREKARRRFGLARLGRVWLLLLVAAVAFLYYRPLATWHETRAELGRRQAEVRSLRSEKVRLEGRLSRAESVETLGREARRLGYVKPGERLFIVKGIAVWERRRVRSSGG